MTHDKYVAGFANRIIEIKDGEIFKDTIINEEEVAEEEKIPIEKNNFFLYKDQLIEPFKMSINSIVAHKMRSLLTMLGIIIGITSVVCVIALGTGSQKNTF